MKRALYDIFECWGSMCTIIPMACDIRLLSSLSCSDLSEEASQDANWPKAIESFAPDLFSDAMYQKLDRNDFTNITAFFGNL